MQETYKRAKKNKGSYGVGRLTVHELESYLDENGRKLQ